MATELVISFTDASPALANREAADLALLINRVAPEVETSQRRTDPNAQDFGATLVLVLGAPALVALAKGVADWLRMRQSTNTKLKIMDKKGLVLVELDAARSADVRALLEGALRDVVGR